MASKLAAVLLALSSVAAQDYELVLDENFDTFNLSLWQHQLTLGGGGNWEFQYYTNNRSNSYVQDGLLYINATLLADEIGDAGVASASLNIYGAAHLQIIAQGPLSMAACVKVDNQMF